jgi:hypothetical protein
MSGTAPFPSATAFAAARALPGFPERIDRTPAVGWNIGSAGSNNAEETEQSILQLTDV